MAATYVTTSIVNVLCVMCIVLIRQLYVRNDLTSTYDLSGIHGETVVTGFTHLFSV